LTAIIGGAVNSGNVLQTTFAALLVLLSLTLVIEGIQTFVKHAKGKKTGVHAR